MARFYTRSLRAGGAAVAEPEPPVAYVGEPVFHLLPSATHIDADPERLTIEAIMTEDVAEVTGVLDGLGGAEADGDDEGADAEGDPRRRRRRRRGGRGAHRAGATSETEAAEQEGVLPGEPALPPQIVEFDASFVGDVPPSSYLAGMVQSGGLVLPDRNRRRRGGYGRADDAPAQSGANGAGRAITPPPTSAPSARSGKGSSLEESITRTNVLLELLLQRQTDMLRQLERMTTAVERGGGTGSGGGGGTAAVAQRVGVFVDVPNIVYAADRINVQIDWGKVLHYVTRGRQLVRATAYSPVSDNARQGVEMERFVAPFYNLPFRILTKNMKRFSNGEIKANFDVELAIDVVAMSDRVDVITLVSGDGDFRRMVELVQAKGVRVEVLAFSSSTAGELRAVCDDYIDIGQHLSEMTITR